MYTFPRAPSFNSNLRLSNIYIELWLRWVFIVVHGLSLAAVSRGYSSLQCVGFSLRWLLLLWSTGSRHVGFSSCGSRASVVVAWGLGSCGSWALECRLSSCGTWALLLRSMWDLPRAGLGPMSPALAGRFSTTAPPGKTYIELYHLQITFIYVVALESLNNSLN